MARASKDVLKNGKVLNELIQRFIKDGTAENLYPVLLCLVDSELYVPMNMNISIEDAKLLENSKVGDEISLKNDLKFKPDWLKNPNNNKLYFPIFSTVNDATEEYSKNFSWINLDIDTCINLADSNKECSGLVLNAFTTPITIEDDIYKVLKDILKEKREKEL